MASGLYLDCFKAYDVRGSVPGQLNRALGRSIIGRAYARLDPAQPGGRGPRHPADQSRTGGALCRGLTSSRASTWSTSAWLAPRRSTSRRSSPWALTVA